MTTHDAMKLQPATLVEWKAPEGYVSLNQFGRAHPQELGLIRIIWDEPAEPDSLLRVHDRRSLAAIKIVEVEEDENEKGNATGFKTNPGL